MSFYNDEVFEEHLIVSSGMSSRHSRRRLSDDELDEDLVMGPSPDGASKRGGVNQNHPGAGGQAE